MHALNSSVAAWEQLSQAVGRQTMQLGVTCLVLFMGATGAGLLPLLVAIPQEHVQLATALSAGLLAGAALAVIVPEGFESFSKAQDSGAASAVPCMFVWSALQPTDVGLLPGAGQVPESAVGAALLGGFILMLLLDQLQGHHHGHGNAHPSSSDEDAESALLSSHERKPSAATLQLQVLEADACCAHLHAVHACTQHLDEHAGQAGQGIASFHRHLDPLPSR